MLCFAVSAVEGGGVQYGGVSESRMVVAMVVMMIVCDGGEGGTLCFLSFLFSSSFSFLFPCWMEVEGNVRGGKEEEKEEGLVRW